MVLNPVEQLLIMFRIGIDLVQDQSQSNYFSLSLRVKLLPHCQWRGHPSRRIAQFELQTQLEAFNDLLMQGANSIVHCS